MLKMFAKQWPRRITAAPSTPLLQKILNERSPRMTPPSPPSHTHTHKQPIPFLDDDGDEEEIIVKLEIC